jgi:phenylalanyl-tRNA synthetase beta chain
VARYNRAHGTAAIAGFEVGRIHFKQGEEYVEPSVAGILIGGSLTPYHWDPKPRDADFFDLKGMVENLCASCKLPKIEFEVSHFSQFHPGRQARILCKGVLLGVLGEVHPSCGFAERLLFAQMDLHQLIALSPSEWKMAPIPTLPGSERDWTVSVDSHISLDHLWRAIHSVGSSLLEKVQLLDLYKSPEIGEDKKNITFRFFYRDQEKTVSFEEVEKEHARIVGAASVFLS